MQLEGNILKMETENRDPVNYNLPIGEAKINLIELTGKQITIEFTDRINCKKCGRITKKSFAQGFCYPCFMSAPEAEECVLRPELCRAHEGIARDMEFAKNHCLIDHYVYLANTGSVKVGITRHTQIPTRWIDQGANSAIIIAKIPNRYLSGLIEVSLKKHIPDKTNWRNMLTGKYGIIDLLMEKQKAIDLLPDDLKQYQNGDNTITNIVYPVTSYPEKVHSFDFDKENLLTGKLTGIKGQYLMFEGGLVVNIRKYEGYCMRVSY